MFTGIISAMGRVDKTESRGSDRKIRFATPDNFLVKTGLGDSIAVNGICLTVTDFDKNGFSADVSRETLDATTAATWDQGRDVNFEHALALGDALGGHLVSGHVDGVSQLIEKHEDARSWRLRFSLPEAFAHYVARKGSVTLDGVSLTVNDVTEDSFGVNIVPHTTTHTTLGLLALGTEVNFEVDLLARYLERLMSGNSLK